MSDVDFTNLKESISRVISSFDNVEINSIEDEKSTSYLKGYREGIKFALSSLLECIEIEEQRYGQSEGKR